MKNKDKIYGLSSDLIHKNVFGREHILKQFIKDIFYENVDDIVYLDKETLKENKNLSYGVSDFLLKINNDYTVIWEMQNKNLYNMDSRIEMSYSRRYSMQKHGKDYSGITPIKAFLLLNYRQGKPKVLKKYEEMDKTIDELFSKYRDTRVWNIREALKKKDTIDYKYALLFTLKEKSVEEAVKILQELKKDEKFREIVEIIELYNADEELYQKLKEEENMEMSFEEATYGIREDARKEGEKRGIITGKMEDAKNLLTLGIDVDTIMKATGLPKEQILNNLVNKKII